MWKYLILIAFILGTVPYLLSQSAADKKPAIKIGKQVDFQLTDSEKKPHHLTALKDKKAFVIVFLGTECPINNLYLVRLGELHKEFAPQGVQFFAINANVQDSPEQIVAHAKKY